MERLGGRLGRALEVVADLQKRALDSPREGSEGSRRRNGGCVAPGGRRWDQGATRQAARWRPARCVQGQAPRHVRLYRQIGCPRPVGRQQLSLQAGLLRPDGRDRPGQIGVAAGRAQVARGWRSHRGPRKSGGQRNRPDRQAGRVVLPCETGIWAAARVAMPSEAVLAASHAVPGLDVARPLQQRLQAGVTPRGRRTGRVPRPAVQPEKRAMLGAKQPTQPRPRAGSPPWPPGAWCRRQQAVPVQAQTAAG